MAAKNKQESRKPIKRKLNPSANREPNNSASKKPKFGGSIPSITTKNNVSKQAFNQQKPLKSKFQKSDENQEKKLPLTKRERRLHAKVAINF